MCYFDRTYWTCGLHRWGKFRQQCPKEYRLGETCGIKLVYDRTYKGTQCKLCDQIEKKQQRLRKMEQNIDQWRKEGNRRATIEKTEHDMAQTQDAIQKIWSEHQAKVATPEGAQRIDNGCDDAPPPLPPPHKQGEPLPKYLGERPQSPHPKGRHLLLRLKLRPSRCMIQSYLRGTRSRRARHRRRGPAHRIDPNKHYLHFVEIWDQSRPEGFTWTMETRSARRIFDGLLTLRIL